MGPDILASDVAESVLRESGVLRWGRALFVDSTAPAVFAAS